MATLNRSNEIILRQGDEIAQQITPKDGKGDTITIASQTITGLTFKAYKYWDDTAEAFSIASVVQSVATDTYITVTPAKTETLGVEAITYIYVLSGTVNGKEMTLVRDQITIEET